MGSPTWGPVQPLQGLMSRLRIPTHRAGPGEKEVGLGAIWVASPPGGGKGAACWEGCVGLGFQRMPLSWGAALGLSVLYTPHPPPQESTFLHPQFQGTLEP